MTEMEFYKRKIFFNETLPELKDKYQNMNISINSWFRSERYKAIQKSKSFLQQKIKQIQKRDALASFTPEQLYELFCWLDTYPNRICYYCGLEESQLETLRNTPGYINKRYPQRGKSLEIDRKKSELPYTNTENLVLACYWCNNAKTDTFTEEEFLQIGNAIKDIWKRRLGGKI